MKVRFEIAGPIVTNIENLCSGIWAVEITNWPIAINAPILARIDDVICYLQSEHVLTENIRIGVYRRTHLNTI